MKFVEWIAYKILLIFDLINFLKVYNYLPKWHNHLLFLVLEILQEKCHLSFLKKITKRLEDLVRKFHSNCQS